MQVSSASNSISLSVTAETLQAAVSGAAKPAPPSPVNDRVDLSQASLEASHSTASLSTTSASLSVAGTSSSKKGDQLGFTLDLQYDEASVSAASTEVEGGADGGSLSYAAIAADVRSTSFSFSLSTTAAGKERQGTLNDEVSKVAKAVKPLVKEFFAATGVKGGWGEVNRLLRSVA